MKAPDRIERAHELRAAIHAWLRANADAQLVELIAAFQRYKPDTVLPRYKPDTVCHAVGRMCKQGLVDMSEQRTYRAVGDSIPPVSETRARLAAAGAENIHIATAAWKKPITKRQLAKIESQKRRDEKAAQKAAAAAKAASTEQITGGKFTYNSGDNPAIARFRSGGQGAVVRPPFGSGMYSGGNW